MTSQTISLRGVFPPIPTPFDTDGNVAHQALKANLERWNDYALSGYVVLGSNGEAGFLSEWEKMRVLDTARAAIPAGKLMIAGTGCESTRQTILLTRQAAQAGADVALIVTPHYYTGKMTSEALARHYEAIADDSPIPVMVYNVPKFTHVDVEVAAVARVARHPNIIGIKDTSGNIVKLADMVRQAGPHFQVLAGSAGFFFPALMVGAVGGILALANIAPRQSIEIYDLYTAGRYSEAADLQRRMIPVNAAVTARFDIAGLKATLDMLGYYGGPVRPPLLDLTESECQALRAIMIEGGVLAKSAERSETP
jgi:4-hydroxy-2-oxoglutarate aldolase